MGLSQKVNFKQRPPLTPPYTGGELITKRFLPLCKGEPEGVACRYWIRLLDTPFYLFPENHFQFLIQLLGIPQVAPHNPPLLINEYLRRESSYGK